MKKVLSLFYLGLQALSFSCEANPFYIPNPFNEEKQVEYFVMYPHSPQEQNPLLLLIHGHQPDPRPGGKQFLNDGILEKYAQKGFIVAAVSQPGYGNSDGPPDYCGPLSQAAAKGVLATLKQRSDVNPDKIFLYGVSRGALVASMVATQDPSLRGVILNAGFYDLRTVVDQRTRENITKETGEMISNIEREAGLIEESMHLRSAADYVSQIESPILMFHGVNDNRAPVAQAIDFFKSLSNNGLSAQLHLFPSGHQTPKEEREALIDIFLKKAVSG